MPYAVITGSASGIGAGIKAKLEDQGYTIIGIDLKGSTIEADLSKPEGRKHAIETALELCESKIDRLVLAAGLGGHLPDGQLVARVNYYGAVTLLDGFKDALADAEGRAVVIGSNSAQMRMDPTNDIVTSMLDGTENGTMQYIGDLPAAVTYAMSKHALSRAVRRRCADFGAAGIRLNVIAPGITETNMVKELKDHEVLVHALNSIPVPMGRFAEIDEIATVIEFMLSDSASYMHGSVIYVDGGTDAQLRPDAF